MYLPDVNVWLAALFAKDDEDKAVLAWLEDILDGPEPVIVTETILVSVVRLATQLSDATLDQALSFVRAIIEAPASQMMGPGPDYWKIFAEILSKSKARGRVVTDAALAAIAVEYDLVIVTFDSDFKRFANVRWQLPPVLNTGL